MVRDSGVVSVFPRRRRTGFAFPSMRILGVRVDLVTMEETLNALEEMVESGGQHHVVTVNPEFVITAREHSRFREVLNQTTLAIPDGIGIVLAGRMMGRRVPERVTGADLVERFAERAAKRGFRFFFLGAAPGVAETAARRLKEKYPGLEIAGTFSGSPRIEEEEELCAMIRKARPHALFVAFGSPNQDLWINRTGSRINVPVSIGVGGTIDFIAGTMPRAPRLLRSIGLEWLYRLYLQPSRWKRMLALPRFVALLLFRGFVRHRAELRYLASSDRTLKGSK